MDNNDFMRDLAIIATVLFAMAIIGCSGGGDIGSGYTGQTDTTTEAARTRGESPPELAFLHGDVMAPDGTKLPHAVVILYANYPKPFPGYGVMTDEDGHYSESDWFYCKDENSCEPVDGITPGEYLLLAVHEASGLYFADKVTLKAGDTEMNITMSGKTSESFVLPQLKSNASGDMMEKLMDEFREIPLVSHKMKKADSEKYPPSPGMAILEGVAFDPYGYRVQNAFVILYADYPNPYPAYLTVTNEDGMYGPNWLYCPDGSTNSPTSEIVPGTYKMVAVQQETGLIFYSDLTVYEGFNLYDIYMYQPTNFHNKQLLNCSDKLPESLDEKIDNEFLKEISDTLSKFVKK